MPRFTAEASLRKSGSDYCLAAQSADSRFITPSTFVVMPYHLRIAPALAHSF